MWTKIKQFFTGGTDIPVIPEQPKVKATPQPRQKKSHSYSNIPKEDSSLSAKELANQTGEPYIQIVKIELDPNNINSGEFELDWNDKFILNLIRAGYKIKESDTDSEMVDRWFQSVCRNVALEVYENSIADPENRDIPPLTNPVTGVDHRIIRSKPLGDGRSEIS